MCWCYFQEQPLSNPVSPVSLSGFFPSRELMQNIVVSDTNNVNTDQAPLKWRLIRVFNICTDQEHQVDECADS